MIHQNVRTSYLQVCQNFVEAAIMESYVHLTALYKIIQHFHAIP